MFAQNTEVELLDDLREEYCYLNLGDVKGPLLLYICPGSCVHGRWEPVLGAAPAPDVQVYQEVAVSLDDDATQSSFLLLPRIGSVVLDMLFNYTVTDWSWDSSSLEVMLSAVRLWKSIRLCSFVCRTWRDASRPFSSLQIPALSGELKTLLPTVPEAVRAIAFKARMINID